jgi:hypothetical protein
MEKEVRMARKERKKIRTKETGRSPKQQKPLLFPWKVTTTRIHYRCEGV